MKKIIDLHQSTQVEHKQRSLAAVKEDFEKHGMERLDDLLEYLYEIAYLKGQVDERQFIDKIRSHVSKW
ncbi:hypothetical protein ABES02_29175 [Neobacillus pocheonensis]|uniref:hypothetical protein n=1 Tax=Neobacillus pocheonensis TaxID=363869 RepID=UPI003D2927BB